MNRSKILVRGNKKKFNRFNNSNGKSMQKEVGKGKTYIKAGKGNKGIIVRGSYSAYPNKITYMSPGQQPFPPRYRTKITSALYGTLPIGTINAHLVAYLNSAYLPFNAGSWPASSVNTLTYTGAGYTQLCNAALYDSCRVFGSRINIEFLPQAQTDTVICTVTPSANPLFPSDVASALDERLTKQLFMSSTKMNSARGSNIKMYISQHRFLGVTSRAIQDDLSGDYTHQYNTVPPVPLYWVVNVSTPDQLAVATALEYKVTLTHYVEFYRNVTPNDN